MTSPTPRTWARWLRRPSTPPPRCPPRGALGCPPSPTCPGAFQVKTTLDLQAQPAAGVGLGCRAGPAVSATLTANSPSEAGGQGSHSCKPGLLNYGASKGLNLNWAQEPESPPDMASFAKMTLSAPKVQSCWIASPSVGIVSQLGPSPEGLVPTRPAFLCLRSFLFLTSAWKPNYSLKAQPSVSRGS